MTHITFDWAVQHSLDKIVDALSTMAHSPTKTIVPIVLMVSAEAEPEDLKEISETIREALTNG